MDIDPHTLQQILEKIRQQLKCPQCSQIMSITFSSLKFVGDSYVVFQLQCEICSAFVMLHTTVTGGTVASAESTHLSRNASSTIALETAELEQLRAAISKSGGKFSDLFERQGS